jgi:hypothetical protein
MYKVWYWLRGLMEVDLCGDRQMAMRRAAAIFTSEQSGKLRLAGVEDERGELLPLADFHEYVRGFRLRNLGEQPSQSPKYFVEVRSPVLLRESIEDEWVRYSVHPTEKDAYVYRGVAEKTFGAGRVRVSPAVAVVQQERVAP